MPAPSTRAEWVARLHDEGLEVPTSWTVLQMKAMWAELKMEGKIVGEAEATDLDGLLAFGNFGHLTYQRVLEGRPSYCKFVTTRAMEEDSPHWRLVRFSRWVAAHKNSGKVKEAIKFRGYKKPGTPSTSSIGSFSMVQDGSKAGPSKEAQELVSQWKILEEEEQVGSPHCRSRSQREDGFRDWSGGGAEPQEPPRDVVAKENEQSLAAEEALKLIKGWHASQNPFSEEWKSLVQHKRFWLMELACFPDSKLSEEIERRYGKGSASRCSVWNGGNLETPEGINHAKRMLDRFRPVHLGIACDCAPFCPLQRLNRRTPEQCQKLEQKQSNARKQYRGAMEVADFAAALNISVHWELSEKNVKLGSFLKCANFLIAM